MIRDFYASVEALKSTRKKRIDEREKKRSAGRGRQNDTTEKTERNIDSLKCVSFSRCKTTRSAVVDNQIGERDKSDCGGDVAMACAHYELRVSIGDFMKLVHSFRRYKRNSFPRAPE